MNDKLVVKKSPLNYSGSKNYIVDQIQNYIPSDINCFVDCMGGAFNVGININKAHTIVYNEFNPFVYQIIVMLLTQNKEKLISKIESTISTFNLSKGDKTNYLKFREYYNSHKEPINLFILLMYCFQNQMRFNNKHNFNTPVGNCSYNETIKERILTFSSEVKDIKFSNKDCNDIDINSYPKDTLFYFDPPYIITNAAYNDGKRGFNGWDEEQEKKLLHTADKINLNGQKFMISNVIYHNGKTNELLLNWIHEKKYKVISLVPHNGRYGSRKEVLIINY